MSQQREMKPNAGDEAKIVKRSQTAKFSQIARKEYLTPAISISDDVVKCVNHENQAKS